MTSLAKTISLAAFALSLLFVAVPSHAQANSFNKFPTSASSQRVNGLQTVTYVPVKGMETNVSFTRKSIKRIVEPVPQTDTLGFSYANDTGTQTLEKGFNKMRPNKKSPARPMKVIVDQRAYTAR